MSRRCGSSKPTPTPLNGEYEADKKRQEKREYHNIIPIIRAVHGPGQVGPGRVRVTRPDPIS